MPWQHFQFFDIFDIFDIGHRCCWCLPSTCTSLPCTPVHRPHHAPTPACTQGVRVGIPQLLSHEATREAFANTYTALAVEIDNIISADAVAADVQAREWVLSLMTFAYDVRVRAQPHLSRRYNHLLYGEDEAQLARALSQDLQSDMQLVEGRMLAQYKDQCYAELDAALEAYFLRDGTLWDKAAMPHGVRPSCMDLLQMLVGIEAELLMHAPMVVDVVLSDLVARLFQVGCGWGAWCGGTGLLSMLCALTGVLLLVCVDWCVVTGHQHAVIHHLFQMPRSTPPCYPVSCRW